MIKVAIIFNDVSVDSRINIKQSKITKTHPTIEERAALS